MKIIPCPVHMIAFWMDCKACDLESQECSHLRSLFRDGVVPDAFDDEARQRYLEWFFDTPERKTSGFIDWLFEHRGIQAQVYPLIMTVLPPDEYEEVKANYGKTESERIESYRGMVREKVMDQIAGQMRSYGWEARISSDVSDVMLVDMRSPEDRKLRTLELRSPLDVPSSERKPVVKRKSKPRVKERRPEDAEARPKRKRTPRA